MLPYWSIPFSKGMKGMTIKNIWLRSEFQMYFCYLLYMWFFNTMAQTVKNRPAVQETQETRVWSLRWEDPQELEMAAHSSMLAWSVLWTEEPGELQSMGSHRVGRDWAHTHHPCFSTQGNFAFQGAFSNIWRYSSHTWRKGATHIFRVEANDTAKRPRTHSNSPPWPKITWPQCLCTVGGNVDWCSHCGKQYEVTSKN